MTRQLAFHGRDGSADDPEKGMELAELERVYIGAMNIVRRLNSVRSVSPAALHSFKLLPSTLSPRDQDRFAAAFKRQGDQVYWDHVPFDELEGFWRQAEQRALAAKTPDTYNAQSRRCLSLTKAWPYDDTTEVFIVD